jgi:hypothetical protein
MKSSSAGLFPVLRAKQRGDLFFCPLLPLVIQVQVPFCLFSRQIRSKHCLVMRVGKPQVIGHGFILPPLCISIVMASKKVINRNSRIVKSAWDKARNDNRVHPPSSISLTLYGAISMPEGKNAFPITIMSIFQLFKSKNFVVCAIA